MPKKKYYAVKKGVQTGIFETWEECRRMVHGVAGAVYKSFADREEAEQYLNGMAGGQHVLQETAEAGNCLKAYVDGSFDKKIRRYSFGCVLIAPNGEIFRESGSDPCNLYTVSSDHFSPASRASPTVQCLHNHNKSPLPDIHASLPI